MTMSSEQSIQPYAGNGVTSTFGIPFRVLDKAHLQVVEITDATGVERVLVENTDFTLSNTTAYTGWLVNLIEPVINYGAARPLPSGVTLEIRRVPPFTQNVDLRNAGTFRPETHENEFDYLTMLAQRLRDMYDRASKRIDAIVTSVVQTYRINGATSGYTDLTTDPIAGAGRVNFPSTAGTEQVAYRSWTLATFAASVGAALVGFIQAGIGAVARTVQDKMRERVSVIDFGAADDNATNNYTAIKKAADRLQALGGGILIFPFTNTGIYKFSIPLGSIMCDFTDLDGIEIRFEGSRLVDTQTYVSAPDNATAFKFTRCKRIKMTGCEITSQSITTAGGAIVAMGLYGAWLVDKCEGFDIDIRMNGGRNAVWVYRDKATMQPASNGRCVIKAKNVLYPYSGTYSGDDVKVQLDADTCGRNFFIYGVSNNWLDVRSKDQQITSLIAGSGGGDTSTIGCRNVWINFYDRETTGSVGAPLMELVFRDAATTYRNININVDAYCAASGGFQGVFRFVRTDSTTGHVVDGFSFSGKSEVANGVVCYHIGSSSVFNSGDAIRNFSVRNFTATGNSATFSIPLQYLDGPTAVFDNVNAETALNVANGSNGNVTFVACKAPYATTGTDVQTYINCVWSSASQSTTNKTLLGTSINGTMRSILPGHVLEAQGIKFPATQVASADANTLDDYEEGTFTPSFTGGISGPGYTTQLGHYVKIGSAVFFRMQLATNAGTGAASNLVVGGLPFTSAQAGAAYLGYDNGTMINSLTNNMPMMFVSGTQITFFNGTGAQMLGTDYSNPASANFYASGWYITT